MVVDAKAEETAVDSSWGCCDKLINLLACYNDSVRTGKAMALFMVMKPTLIAVRNLMILYFGCNTDMGGGMSKFEPGVARCLSTFKATAATQKQAMVEKALSPRTARRFRC